MNHFILTIKTLQPYWRVIVFETFKSTQDDNNFTIILKDDIFQNIQDLTTTLKYFRLFNIQVYDKYCSHKMVTDKFNILKLL